ncbi:MAG TPA: CBS domain-containing protein [Planctomycetota bacterium]
MLTVQTILAQKGREIFHVSPDATVLDALREMAARSCGALLVLDRGRPVGMLSERDYARKVVLMGRVSSNTLVREIMNEEVVCVPIGMGVDKCMALMTEYRSRHLLVRDGDVMVGVISIGDVVKALMDEQQSTIDQLQHYITGY